MAIVNPLHPIDDKYRTWLIDEIYVGPNGPAKAKYVPNVNDRVEDWNSGYIYRVTFVDGNTGLSTLAIWNAPSIPDTDDRFIGSLPHYLYSVFMLFVNKSLLPHTVAVDNCVRIFSTQATKCKVFRGTDLTEAGQVISRRYNHVNEFIGEDIPLIPVIDNDDPLRTVKVPETFYTNVSDLEEGEDCTLVAYNDADTVVAICRLIVIETDFIREIDSSKKYITNIYMETPFLSSLSTDVVQLPSNIILADVQKFGVVVYSNGDKVRYPIDGTKFALAGMDDFIPTIPGARIPLSLVYHLAGNEVNNLIINEYGNSIVKDFWAECLAPDGTYGVKLYVTPTWDNDLQEYRLEYYMYNLDRDVFYHVTDFVEYTNNSPGFLADTYGLSQTLGVSLDLSYLNAGFKAYRHVQTFTVILKAAGTSLDTQQTRWEVIYEPGQSPKAGEGWFARKLFVNGATGFDVDISCGVIGSDGAAIQEWLNKVYWPNKPIYNLSTEGVSNLTPTHFRIRSSMNAMDALTTELPLVSALNGTHVLEIAGMSDGEIVYIDFVKKVNTVYLEMATAGLSIVTDIA